MRFLLLFALGCSSAVTGAMTPAAKPSGPVPPEVPISDPSEYTIDRVSRDAGEAIFARTGIGDPYRTGVPYPVFLALQRAFPEQLGDLARRYGFVARAANATSADLDEREGLPVGMHLTVDPLTGVPFVVTNCALCHAERIRWPGGEALVIGLANKRVRVHDYDAAFATITTAPRFSADHIGRLACEAAEQRHIAWPDTYRDALVGGTLEALRRRAAERADLRARTAHGEPGLVATIDSFVGPLAQLTGHSIQYAPEVGWAKVPDVIGFAHRTTLNWDSSGQGSMDLLAVEADVAVGVRPAWLEHHPLQGPSLGAYLRSPEPRPAFPGHIDRELAARGKRRFADQCEHCHGTYAADGRVLTYEEQVVPLADLGTDPARAFAPTDSFERAANDPALTHGYTRFQRTGGYVPPVLTNVWARAPYGHAGQWASLAVVATAPAARPTTRADVDAVYDLERVGLPQSSRPSQVSVLGHPFLADLGDDARAVIEYLKTL
jgi:hypothetical protein